MQTSTITTKAISIYVAFTRDFQYKSLLISDLCSCSIIGEESPINLESPIIDITASDKFILKNTGTVKLVGIVADGTCGTSADLGETTYVIEEVPNIKTKNTVAINKNGKRSATTNNNVDEFDYGGEYIMKAQSNKYIIHGVVYWNSGLGGCEKSYYLEKLFVSIRNSSDLVEMIKRSPVFV
jgi:hypothetical protein